MPQFGIKTVSTALWWNSTSYQSCTWDDRQYDTWCRVTWARDDNLALSHGNARLSQPHLFYTRKYELGTRGLLARFAASLETARRRLEFKGVGTVQNYFILRHLRNCRPRLPPLPIIIRPWNRSPSATNVVLLVVSTKAFSFHNRSSSNLAYTFGDNIIQNRTVSA